MTPSPAAHLATMNLMPPDLTVPAGPLSEAITHGIRIEAMSRHVPEKSSSNEGQWVFEYTVRITNQSDRPMQLISRHWFITDAFDQVREVQGMGVVGQQPTLQPGEQFQYSSWCPLATPTGMMHGTYLMKQDDAELLTVAVAPFALRARYTVQ